MIIEERWTDNIDWKLFAYAAASKYLCKNCHKFEYRGVYKYLFESGAGSNVLGPPGPPR